MADLELRFNKDALVLSTPVKAALDRLDVDAEHDLEFTLLFEPEVIEEVYKIENITGAQCIVAPTASFTPARLAHTRMADRAEALADAAMQVVESVNPPAQHVLVEIGPCGLPLDGSSKASLMESRDQYARAAKEFAGKAFDAFFLNGFESCTDLKCALMGVRKVSDAPILASVDVDAGGVLPKGRGEVLKQAVSVMMEYGAQVVGFQVQTSVDQAADLVEQAHAVATDGEANVMEGYPVLVQLDVADTKALTADDMFDVASTLIGAGAQFLRATGKATPAYAGALVAGCMEQKLLAQQAQEQLQAAGEWASGASAGARPEIDVEAVRQRVRDALN